MTDWTTVIRPERGLLDFRLGELWRYRELIFLFARRDFVAQYKQTILGPVWHFINPLVTTGVFTVVFGQIAGIPTDGIPPFLFYLSGTTIWNYFQRALSSTATTFTSNSGLFGKVYFPRLAVPISKLLTNLVAFSIQFVLFVGVLLFLIHRGAPVAPGLLVLTTPLLVLIMAGLGLGAGVISSALTARYRDLAQLVAYGTTLLMYFTPVIYPYSEVPADLQILVLANPVTSVIEAFRYAFLGKGYFNPLLVGYSGVVALAVMTGGILLFHRVERTFMDTV